MSGRRPTGLPAAGAAAAGAAAAGAATLTGACCVAPPLATLSVAVLGASGAAWAAGFAPWAPWLLAGSAFVLGWGFWSVERAARLCRSGDAAPPRSLRFARWTLAVAAALWLGSVALNLLSR